MQLDDLKDDDCFALRQASRHISKLYELYLSEVGITPTQFSILRTLGHFPSLTMAELATAMAMDRTTLVRALKPCSNVALWWLRSKGKAIGDFGLYLRE
jgi:hypothetical protein